MMSGGSATAGGVSSYYFGIPGGLFEEVDKVEKKLREDNFLNLGLFNPDSKGFVLEQETLKSGGEIMYESTIAGIYLNNTGDEVCGVKVLNNGNVINVECKILIDATAEGEAAAAAGAEFSMGRKIDKQPQPFSSVRIFINKEQKRLGMANFDAGYVRPDNAEDMTKSILTSNSFHIPESSETRLDNLWFSIVPGLRESRLLKCDKTLTLNDFFAKKPEENIIAWCYSNFDSHTQDWAFEDEKIKDWIVAGSLWGYNLVFPLPLEATLVTGFKNIIATGRCLSVDHDMACALRMQRGMQKLGEAAGIVAKLATDNGNDIRKINKNILFEKLKASGTLNNDGKDNKIKMDTKEILESLASDSPGIAIWHIADNYEKYKAETKEWLSNENTNIAYNTALAMGIAKNTLCIPILRKIITNRDRFLPKSSRSHNQSRILGALWLLGKLNATSAFEEITEVLKEAAESQDFQEFSHSMITLLELGNKNKNLRKDIAKILESTMLCKQFSVNLLLKGGVSNRIIEPMTQYCKIVAGKFLYAWGFESIINSVKPETCRDKRLIKEFKAEKSA
jgi:hypothetical protein